MNCEFCLHLTTSHAQGRCEVGDCPCDGADYGHYLKHRDAGGCGNLACWRCYNEAVKPSAPVVMTANVAQDLRAMATTLREIRHETELTAQEVATKLGWSIGRVCNYETGARTGSASIRDIMILLDFYGARLVLLPPHRVKGRN